jgi:uncharacterized protein
MKRDDLLDLNDALQHPGRKIAVDISTEMPDESEIELIDPCEGFLEAMSTGNMLLLTGEFKAKCIVDCARCGAPLEKEVIYEVDEQFPVEGTPSSYAQDDYAKVVAEEDYPLFENNSLMVENLIHQGLVINLPMQPLCQHGWDEACPQATARQAAMKSEALRPEFEQLSGLFLPDGEPNE